MGATESAKTWYGTILPLLQLDGIFYLMIDLDSVLMGFSDIDIKLNDNREEFECIMVSGHVDSSVEEEHGDTVQPLPA